MKVLIRTFFQNVSTYFGGIICSLCSPLSKMFYKFEKGEFSIRWDPTMCVKKLYWIKFALKIGMIYNLILFPLGEFVKCIANQMENPEYGLGTLNYKNFTDKLLEVSICERDAYMNDHQCAQLCDLDFQKVRIPMKFIRQYKQILKSIIIII